MNEEKIKTLKQRKRTLSNWKNFKKSSKGITLIALVITIVLNSSYLAMDRINKIEKI